MRQEAQKKETGYIDQFIFKIDNQKKINKQGSSQDWTYFEEDIETSGEHTLRWNYSKYDGELSTYGAVWIDYLAWDPDEEQEDETEITYTYSPSGQRISKTVDDVTTKYFYDGGNVIAEYDDSNDLVRKYIYGPGVDEPLCMIDVEDSNSVYYYHFDGLGSVVALSDAAGDTIQSYEYSIYGRVRGTDPNIPNPYLFTGRRFDTETGLYYYRARYYNPYIGRFMQIDPVDYEVGMNGYLYCFNNPVSWIDPTGMFATRPYFSAAFDMVRAVDGGDISGTVDGMLRMYWWICSEFFIKPDYPGDWGLIDYFRWYFTVESQSVNLEDTGLLDHIKEALETDLRRAEDAIIDAVEVMWRARQQFKWLKNQPFTKEFTQKITYSLYGTNPPLVVLGEGDLIQNAYAHVDADGFYRIGFSYFLSDPFDGVLSGGIPWALGKWFPNQAGTIQNIGDWIEKHFGEFDIPRSQPYNMWARWYTRREGQF